MQQRIVFLGTGGDSFVVGKQLRGSGGIVLRTEDLQFHIDPGPGSLTMAKMWGVNIRENHVVLCTSAHLNHSHDLNAVISAMTYNGMDTAGIIMGPKTVIEGVDDCGPSLSRYHRKLVTKLIELNVDKRLAIEDVEIKPLPTFHSDPHAIGFRFTTPHYTICYSGDTGYHQDLIESYKDCDVLILNTVFPANSDKSDDHLSTEDAAILIDEVRPALCIITHFGKKMIESDPIQEARDLQIKTGVQCIAARDGLVIDPMAYRRALQQHTIQDFNVE